MKENVFSGSHSDSQGLTDEQRTRITKNFRAAKALLAGKRPYETIRVPSKNADGNMEGSWAPKWAISRFPLREIQTNLRSPSSSEAGVIESTYNDKSCPRIRTADSPLPVQFGLEMTEVASKERVGMLPKECEESKITTSFYYPGLVEEDFDESLLTEIDAICEQQSTAKKETQNISSNLSMENTPKERTEYSRLETVNIKVQVEIRSEPVVKPQGNSTSSQESDVGCMSKEYLNYIQSLNEEQKEAACTDISIPLMIVAGPGSGKTSTMVGRILTLLKEGIGPASILAMTFTTAGASEMKERIGSVVGKAIAKELIISTFHSFCLQLCRSHAEKLGRTSDFLIYGHGQQRRAVIEALRLMEDVKKSEHNCGPYKLEDSCRMIGNVQNFKDKSKKWLKFVTQAKAAGKTPEDFRKVGDEISASILGNYNNILRSCNALDYHDFISSSVMLLTNFSKVYEECQDQWKAIVVDEFQDTSGMQYNLLRILASHNHITVIGDDDQSIFSFNGANICGFDSFRKDFPTYKEVRLTKNYRSTRCIVEAASSLIHHNVKRCHQKAVITDNSMGSKIVVKECNNEEAQCTFVVDKIIELTSDVSATKCAFGNISVLYRRQVSGKAFQTAFRDRKIPFNVHGVAFYRKKVIKAIMAMLRTALPCCDDGPFRQAFKALLPCEKDEKKRVIDYIDKISTTGKCSFVSAASNIFGAKVSGTFKRNQLSQGRKVLVTLEMISKLVRREQSISEVVTSVTNMLHQKYLLEKRAVVDVEGGRLLNEDDDLRSVLQYLLEDVSDFLSMHYGSIEATRKFELNEGCIDVLQAFIDYVLARENENFRARKRDNENSVTLTTIHQSKGLEWDTVFIVKANETEIPLLHEFNGGVECGSNLEEERRLMYVAMTRARKRLFILYVTLDSYWQLLLPSRFLKEIPCHLLEHQTVRYMGGNQAGVSNCAVQSPNSISRKEPSIVACGANIKVDEIASSDSMELAEANSGNVFLRRFSVNDRSTVSHIFHQWAKKQAFQDPKRLLDKVGFVIDERLGLKTSKNKGVLRALKGSLNCDEAFQYAQYVLRWGQIPADKRAHLIREKQEHFQKQRIESSMSSSAATSKQGLGCTVVPTSRLHASRLIEQYKSL
ncbi:ATP-dependent DNA helicase SRS2-like protein At4g25120 isoform X2 [Aristolochia californica]|uniref:ATP-dependent DNA helicase SRS2-like protein At4g25120 isoform X2 n=1 Tax=Aristolochia californica TaxID=171875 RepID=UPI0035E048E9